MGVNAFICCKHDQLLAATGEQTGTLHIQQATRQSIAQQAYMGAIPASAHWAPGLQGAHVVEHGLHGGVALRVVICEVAVALTASVVHLLLP